MRNALRIVVVICASLVGISATAASAPSLTLESATVTAKWRESWLTGSVRFSGTAGAPAELNVSLRPARRAGPQAARISVTAGADGRFSGQLKLPARLLPDVYIVRVWGTSGATTLTPAEREVTVPAPAEGVVDRAFATPSRTGPPAVVVAGPRRILYAHFHFLVPPRSGRVTASWYTPSFRWVGTVTKPYSTDFVTFVRGAGTLEKGRWWCFLRSSGRVIKRARIRIT